MISNTHLEASRVVVLVAEGEGLHHADNVIGRRCEDVVQVKALQDKLTRAWNTLTWNFFGKEADICGKGSLVRLFPFHAAEDKHASFNKEGHKCVRQS